MPSRLPSAGVAALGVFALVVGSGGLIKNWPPTVTRGQFRTFSDHVSAGPEEASAPNDPCDVARLPNLEGYVASVITPRVGRGAPIDIAVIDVDLDGHQDIVVSRGGLDTAPVREQGVMEVLYGPHVRPKAACNTTIEMGADAPVRRWESSAIEAYGKMAIGDVDDNGCPDIVVGKFTGGIDVFFGTKTLKGTCRLDGRPTSLSVTSARDATGSFPRGTVGVAAVQLVDLDGDSLLDLVVARYHRDYGLRGVVQQVYWNEGGTKPFSDSAVWESKEGITAAMSVLAVDVDGDDRTDVLFGTRAVWNESGMATTAWGVWYRGGPGRSLSTTGQALRRTEGDADPLKSPMVVDMKTASRVKPARVLVSSSLHWCNGFPTCEKAAKLEVYEWSGDEMQRTTRFAGETPGNWLPASVGSLDNNPNDSDVAVGFGCGKANQSPGHLRVYRGSDRGAAYGYRDHLIRAVTIADLRGGTSAVRGDGEIIFGSISTNSSNTGAITILFRCNET